MSKMTRVRNVFLGIIAVWGIGHVNADMLSDAETQVTDPETTPSVSQQMPAWMRPSPYRYNPSTPADPFVPFIRKEELPASQGDAASAHFVSPLERIDVTQLTAVGILWYPEGKGNTVAMVQLPDGKGFVLQKGMRIGRHQGVVSAITPEQVVVREQVRNIFGKQISKDVLIKLHRKQGVQYD